MIDTLAPPSSAFLWAACNILESAHEYEDIKEAENMLAHYNMTYEQAMAELQNRGVIPS